MTAAALTEASRRVWWTIWMIVCTPRPSGPTRRAQVSSYSISAEAFERLPSLSLSRCRKKRFCVPSGRKRGTRKQVSPPGPCASVRKASDMGAEQNHLCPVRRKIPSPSPAAGRARVELARTSEPPCFSVIAMPKIAPSLSRAGMKRASYSVDRMRGVHSSASAGSLASAGTAAKVIAIGQQTPFSPWFIRKASAALTACAPRCFSRQGSACTACPTPSAIR